MLVRQLPDRSRVGRAVHGDDVATWDTANYQLADVFDALNVGNWQRGGGKGKKPKRYPRPGTKRRHGRTSLSPREAALRLVAVGPRPK